MGPSYQRCRGSTKSISGHGSRYPRRGMSTPGNYSDPFSNNRGSPSPPSALWLASSLRVTGEEFCFFLPVIWTIHLTPGLPPQSQTMNIYKQKITSNPKSTARIQNKEKRRGRGVKGPQSPVLGADRRHGRLLGGPSRELGARRKAAKEPGSV